MKNIEVSKDSLTEIIFRAMPYAEQIKEWDTAKDERAVYFIWRHQQFRVTTSLNCETVRSPFLEGSDISILLEALLEKQYVADFISRRLKESK